MPAPDVADLRAMSDDELGGELEETRRALFNLRFQAATRQLADVSQVRAARRRVARIKTLQRERELIAAYGAAEATEVEAVESEPEETEPVEAEAADAEPDDIEATEAEATEAAEAEAADEPDGDEGQEE